MTDSEGPRTESRSLGPLGVIAIFAGLCEVALGTGIATTTGNLQITMIVGAFGLALIIVGLFALVLWFKPQAFYPPAAYPETLDPKKYAEAMQVLSNRETEASAPAKGSARPPTDGSTSPSLETESESFSSSESHAEGIEEQPLWHMYRAFWDGNLDAAEEAFNTLQASEQDPARRVHYEAIYLSHRYHLSDSSALGKLEQLAHDNPAQRVTVLFALASCYLDAKDVNSAKATYERAFEAATTEESKSRAASHIAACDRQLNQTERGLALLTSMLGETTTNTARSHLFEEIASSEEARGNKTMKALALDKVAQYKPENVDARFSAAYAQSEADLHRLALLSYDVLLNFDPKHYIALNNRGVQLMEMKIPFRAVSSYRKSAEGKETLAMANIASLYLKAGFEQEAKTILEDAMKEEEPHGNVAHTIASIAERRQKEEDKYRDVLEGAEREQRFLRVFTDAHYLPCDIPEPFQGQWVDSDGTAIQFAQTADSIAATWENKSIKRTLTGRAHNRAARVAIMRESTQVRSTLLSALTHSKTEGYAYLTPDGLALEIMTLADDSSDFLVFTRPPLSS